MSDSKDKPPILSTMEAAIIIIFLIVIITSERLRLKSEIKMETLKKEQMERELNQIIESLRQENEVMEEYLNKRK